MGVVRHAFELPESLMAAIAAVTADESVSPQDRFEAAVLITYGYALYSEADGIDGRNELLPKRQWEAICRMLTDIRPGSAVDRVNYGLSWVNIGPSAQEQ